MNQTTNLERRLRHLTRLIARAREAATQQTHQRDWATERYGLAHPRSIAATRHLNHTASVYRSLMRMSRMTASDLARHRGHQ
jgi:hypothetical protein